MGQYNHQAVGDSPPQVTKEQKIESLIENLQAQIARQERLIESLERDVRRLKHKLTRHADTINGMNNG